MTDEEIFDIADKALMVVYPYCDPGKAETLDPSYWDTAEIKTMIRSNRQKALLLYRVFEAALANATVERK